MANGPAAQTVEGMWWKQESDVTAFVALSNTSAQPVQAQLQISDGLNRPLGAHSLTVSPHGTKIVNLNELQSTAIQAGGLRITYSGTTNQLVINGGLEDQANGYSAGLPFVPISASSANAATQSYAELGLMAGAADPMMQFPAGTTFTPYSVLRNVSGQAATVTPAIYWMEAGTARSVRLAQLTLPAYQTQSLDVVALLSSAGLKNFNGSFNLAFDVQGSVLMTSGSVDQKNTYVFEVLPTVVKESASKNLGYWSTANGDDTMVTLWNPADEAQDYIFTVFFSGGHYDLPMHLGPRATRMFNLSEIAQNQTPDSAGNIIPADVHEGSAKISGTQGENELILVALDSGTYNVQKATCAWRCNTCHGVIFNPVPWVAANPWAVAVGGNTALTFNDQWDTGRQYNLTSRSSWSSSATNIATVNTGLVNGVAAGNVNIDGIDLGEPWAGNQCGSPAPACPADQGVSGSGGGTVQGCPASVAVASTSQESLANMFPGTKTGVGAMAKMQVSPSTTNWNGSQLTELLSPISTTCPAEWAQSPLNLCKAGTTPFTVGGIGANVTGRDGEQFPNATNIFYDEHVWPQSTSTLPSNMNSCQFVCGQQYVCGGVVRGNFTITFSFSHGTIQNTPVTNISVTKQ